MPENRIYNIVKNIHKVCGCYDAWVLLKHLVNEPLRIAAE